MLGAKARSAHSGWALVGGAGYIGSHVAWLLHERAAPAIVIDDMSSGSADRLPPGTRLIEASCRSESEIIEALSPLDIEGVMHFASRKNARESVDEPILYWDSILGGTISVLRVMQEVGISRLVYSSSCAIFGEGAGISEDSAVRPASPYGAAKVAAEQLIRSQALATGLRAINLRYFNVIGNSSRAGSRDTSPGHLVPDMVRVIADGGSPRVRMAQKPTRDGSCVRDFVDVRDIARAHVSAAQRLTTTFEYGQVEDFNLSTGEPITTKAAVESLMNAMGCRLPVSLAPPAPGDPSIVHGRTSVSAQTLLGWYPQFCLEDSMAQVAASVAEDFGK